MLRDRNRLRGVDVRVGVSKAVACRVNVSSVTGVCLDIGKVIDRMAVLRDANKLHPSAEPIFSVLKQPVPALSLVGGL